MSKVIIAGSINMDIVATSNTHPKIGETVFGSNLQYFPGGKGANQAVSSAKLGGDTVMIGMVGQDGFGTDLVTFLESQNIENQIKTCDKPTGTAIITVSKETSDNTIVVIPGANFELRPEALESIPVNQKDILVSQFEIPVETITAFFKNGKPHGSINILNPAPAKIIPDDLFNLVDILVVNETELAVISKQDVNSKESIINAVAAIQKPKQSIIVTLGAKGATLFTDNEHFHVEGCEVSAVDTTGAGDCFVGAIAAQLSQGKNLKAAVQFANIAASICVTRPGAGPSMPTVSEVESKS